MRRQYFGGKFSACIIINEQLYSSVTRLTDLSNLFYFQYDLVDAPKHLYKVIITNLRLLSMD